MIRWLGEKGEGMIKKNGKERGKIDKRRGKELENDEVSEGREGKVEGRDDKGRGKEQENDEVSEGNEREVRGIQ